MDSSRIIGIYQTANLMGVPSMNDFSPGSAVGRLLFFKDGSKHEGMAVIVSNQHIITPIVNVIGVDKPIRFAERDSFVFQTSKGEYIGVKEVCFDKALMYDQWEETHDKKELQCDEQKQQMSLYNQGYCNWCVMELEREIEEQQHVGALSVNDFSMFFGRSQYDERKEQRDNQKENSFFVYAQNQQCEVVSYQQSVIVNKKDTVIVQVNENILGNIPESQIPVFVKEKNNLGGFVVIGFAEKVISNNTLQISLITRDNFKHIHQWLNGHNASFTVDLDLTLDSSRNLRSKELLDTKNNQSAHSSSITSICKLQGYYAASSSLDGQIKIWNYRTAQLKKIFKTDRHCQQIFAQGDYLIAVCGSILIIIDWKKRKVVNIQAHEKQIVQVCQISRENQEVIVIDKDNRIVMYKFDGEEKIFKEIIVINGIIEKKKKIILSEDNQEVFDEERFTIGLVIGNSQNVVIGSNKGNLWVFDWKKKGFIGCFKVGEKDIKCMVQYPLNNELVVVCSKENQEELLVWKIKTGELVKKIDMKGIFEKKKEEQEEEDDCRRSQDNQGKMKMNIIGLKDKDMVICNGLDYYVLTMNNSGDNYTWKNIKSGHNNPVSVLLGLDDEFFLSGDLSGRLRVQQIEQQVIDYYQNENFNFLLCPELNQRNNNNINNTINNSSSNCSQGEDDVSGYSSDKQQQQQQDYMREQEDIHTSEYSSLEYNQLSDRFTNNNINNTYSNTDQFVTPPNYLLLEQQLSMSSCELKHTSSFGGIIIEAEKIKKDLEKGLLGQQLQMVMTPQRGNKIFDQEETEISNYFTRENVEDDDQQQKEQDYIEEGSQVSQDNFQLQQQQKKQQKGEEYQNKTRLQQRMTLNLEEVIKQRQMELNGRIEDYQKVEKRQNEQQQKQKQLLQQVNTSVDSREDHVNMEISKSSVGQNKQIDIVGTEDKEQVDQEENLIGQEIVEKRKDDQGTAVEGVIDPYLSSSVSSSIVHPLNLQSQFSLCKKEIQIDSQEQQQQQNHHSVVVNNNNTNNNSQQSIDNIEQITCLKLQLSEYKRLNTSLTASYGVISKRLHSYIEALEQEQQMNQELSNNNETLRQQIQIVTQEQFQNKDTISKQKQEIIRLQEEVQSNQAFRNYENQLNIQRIEENSKQQVQVLQEDILKTANQKQQMLEKQYQLDLTQLKSQSKEECDVLKTQIDTISNELSVQQSKNDQKDQMILDLNDQINILKDKNNKLNEEYKIIQGQNIKLQQECEGLNNQCQELCKQQELTKQLNDQLSVNKDQLIQALTLQIQQSSSYQQQLELESVRKGQQQYQQQIILPSEENREQIVQMLVSRKELSGKKENSNKKSNKIIKQWNNLDDKYDQLPLKQMQNNGNQAGFKVGQVQQEQIKKVKEQGLVLNNSISNTQNNNKVQDNQNYDENLRNSYNYTYSKANVIRQRTTPSCMAAKENLSQHQPHEGDLLSSVEDSQSNQKQAEISQQMYKMKQSMNENNSRIQLSQQSNNNNNNRETRSITSNDQSQYNQFNRLGSRQQYFQQLSISDNNYNNNNNNTNTRSCSPSNYYYPPLPEHCRSKSPQYAVSQHLLQVKQSPIASRSQPILNTTSNTTHNNNTSMNFCVSQSSSSTTPTTRTALTLPSNIPIPTTPPPLPASQSISPVSRGSGGMKNIKSFKKSITLTNFNSQPLQTLSIASPQYIRQPSQTTKNQQCSQSQETISFNAMRIAKNQQNSIESQNFTHQRCATEGNNNNNLVTQNNEQQITKTITTPKHYGITKRSATTNSLTSLSYNTTTHAAGKPSLVAAHSTQVSLSPMQRNHKNNNNNQSYVLPPIENSYQHQQQYNKDRPSSCTNANFFNNSSITAHNNNASWLPQQLIAKHSQRETKQEESTRVLQKQQQQQQQQQYTQINGLTSSSSDVSSLFRMNLHFHSNSSLRNLKSQQHQTSYLHLNSNQSAEITKTTTTTSKPNLKL